MRTLSIYLEGRIRIIKPHMITFGIIMLAGITVLTWFRGFLIYHWDTVFPFNPAAMMKAFFWPWSDLISTGTPILSNHTLPYFALVYFLHDLLGLSLLNSQISIYYLILVMGGAATYLFFLGQSIDKTRRSKELRFGALVSALVYMFNPYSMIEIWMVFSLEAFLYATLPLFLLLFQRGLTQSTKGRIDWKVITGLAGLSVFAAPVLGIPAYSIPVLIGLAIFYVIWLLNPEHLQKWKGSAQFVTLAVLALFAVNIWWIYPTIFLYSTQLMRAGGASYGATGLGDLLHNSMHTDYFNVFRLVGMSPFYNSGVYPHYDFAWMYQTFFPITLISLMIPASAFLGLILSGSPIRQHSKLFAAACILGVVPIAAGLQPPFGEMFTWLALNIPAVAVLFRDSYQKFGFWLPFGYSFLIGASFSALAGHTHRGVHSDGGQTALARPTWSYRRVIVLSMILILITSGYVWPMFTGEVIPIETPTLPSPRIQIPEYYYQAATWLQSQQGTFSILSLPEDQILQSSAWAHGYVGGDILRYLTGGSIISSNPQVPGLDAFQHGLYAYISNGGDNISRVLKLFDVRFVLLRTDAAFYPGSATQPANTSQLRTYLESQPEITASKQFGPLLFFELKDHGPRLFATAQIMTASQANGIGWDLANYDGGWQANSLNESKFGSALSLTFRSPGSYSYGYLTNSQALNISIVSYPYIKANFSSSSNAALLLRVTLANQTTVWLTALGSGNATSYLGNHYSSTRPTTITYDLSELTNRVKNFDVFVTNSPNPTSQSVANVSIYGLTFESYIGQPEDYVREIARQSENPTSFVIVDSDSIANQGLTNYPPPAVSYSQLDPMDYEVQVTNASSSFMLVFGETFDPLWRLVGSPPFDPSIAVHVMVDGFANGWLIRTPGNFGISIMYGPGRTVLWAYGVSLVSGLILAAVPVLPIVSRAKHRGKAANSLPEIAPLSGPLPLKYPQSTSFRLWIAIGVLVLVSATIVSAIGWELVGNLTAITAYFIFVLGMILGLSHYMRQGRTDRPMPPSQT